jgi:hypothetical protein
MKLDFCLSLGQCWCQTEPVHDSETVSPSLQQIYFIIILVFRQPGKTEQQLSKKCRPIDNKKNSL